MTIMGKGLEGVQFYKYLTSGNLINEILPIIAWDCMYIHATFTAILVSMLPVMGTTRLAHHEFSLLTVFTHRWLLKYLVADELNVKHIFHISLPTFNSNYIDTSSISTCANFHST